MRPHVLPGDTAHSSYTRSVELSQPGKESFGETPRLTRIQQNSKDKTDINRPFGLQRDTAVIENAFTQSSESV